jgi:hypothetical protein
MPEGERNPDPRLFPVTGPDCLTAVWKEEGKQRRFALTELRSPSQSEISLGMARLGLESARENPIFTALPFACLRM